jgi:mercuric ion transport protein
MKQAERRSDGPMELTGAKAAASQGGDARPSASGGRGGLIAAGGLFGSIMASTCCVVPLILVSLGAGGAWLGNLTALEPVRPYSIALAVGLIGLGFWSVYFRRKAVCAAGAVCTKPVPGRVVKVILWITTAMVLQAATVGLWAPLFY